MRLFEYSKFFLLSFMVEEADARETCVAAVLAGQELCYAKSQLKLMNVPMEIKGVHYTGK